MSNNPFANMSTDGFEKTEDRLGGGYQPLESGIYDADIQLVYLGKAQNSQARSVTVHAKIDGKDYRETFWVTNKKDENFYTKDGKKYPLPGFVTFDELCLMATGRGPANQDYEEKVVKLYDFQAKAEVNTNVTAVTSLHGKKVKLAIWKVKEDKTTKQGNEYVPTGEFRFVNEIDKVFHFDSKRTTNEFRENKQATFHDKWAEKNTGELRDKSTGRQGNAGAPPVAGGGQSSNNAAPSLFGE